MTLSVGAQALAVAGGAALGALLRWRAAAWLNHLHPLLPPGTLLVNLVGGFATGVALAWLADRPNQALQLFAVVGVLGGLTTFSAFSGESLALLLRGAVPAALLHTAAHVTGALASCAAGWWLGQAIFGTT